MRQRQSAAAHTALAYHLSEQRFLLRRRSLHNDPLHAVGRDVEEHLLLSLRAELSDDDAQRDSASACKSSLRVAVC